VEALDALVSLVDRLRDVRPLGELLQLVADATSEILHVDRVSVRLLDPEDESLTSVARAGQPLHDHPVEFHRGEGLLGWIVEHTRVLRLADAEADPRFAPRDGRARRMGAFLGVPICAGDACTGVLSAVSEREFDREQERLLVLIAALCAPRLEIARLARLSRVDPLTGVLNRRALDVDGAAAAPRAVAMVDIDHFKRVNDAHGHAAGDVVLRHVADLIASSMRAGDEVIRYGGEEFLLVLPDIDRATAARVAERARSAVASTPSVIGDLVIGVTLSVGVAERRDGESRDSLISRADGALYRAKELGRDRVEVAE
jgi:diguanylate cyclase (GGDEF)-like protein